MGWKFGSGLSFKIYFLLRKLFNCLVCLKGEVKGINKSPMFWKLFNYISGNNDQQQKIAMTTPVLMNYQNNDNGLVAVNSNVNVSMQFFVPHVYQANTPIPSDDSVNIIDQPETIFATYRFSTNFYETMYDYIKNRDILIEKLGNEAKNYDTANMITAGYQSPYSFFGRRNEVLLRKITN